MIIHRAADGANPASGWLAIRSAPAPLTFAQLPELDELWPTCKVLCNEYDAAGTWPATASQPVGTRAGNGQTLPTDARSGPPNR